MNHKRGRPKCRRAGCLMCKPHKAKLTPRRDWQKFGVWRRMVVADEKIGDVT